MPASFSRRSFLATAMGALVVQQFCTSAVPARASTRRVGRTFFVAASGDDAASGDAETAAWRTPARLNAAMASGTVAGGDSVLFRGGDSFAGSLRPVDALDGPLRIGAFGGGDRPVISTYLHADVADAWLPVGDDLWQLDVSRSAAGRCYSGYVSDWSTEIGFLLVDGVIHGDRKDAMTDLSEEWQFVSAGAKLTVMTASNPALSHVVSAAVADPIVIARSGLELDGLRFIGSGRNGIQTASDSLVHTVVIRNCEVAEIGGGRVNSIGERYGNGVQVWSGATSVLVENTAISDCWDAAMTAQGPGTTAAPWTDVTFSGNIIERCMQSFESWTQGTLSPTTAGASCRFVGNECGAAGTSWSAGLRRDRSGKGTHLLFYGDDLQAELEVTDNSFGPPTDNYLLAAPSTPTNLRSDRNVIRLAPWTPLQFGRTETLVSRSAWTARTGLEVNSFFDMA